MEFLDEVTEYELFIKKLILKEELEYIEPKILVSKHNPYYVSYSLDYTAEFGIYYVIQFETGLRLILLLTDEDLIFDPSEQRIVNEWKRVMISGVM